MLSALFCADSPGTWWILELRHVETSSDVRLSSVFTRIAYPDGVRVLPAAAGFVKEEQQTKFPIGSVLG